MTCPSQKVPLGILLVISSKQGSGKKAVSSHSTGPESK